MSFKIKRNIKFICLGAEIYGWASQSELEFGHGQQLNMTRANTFIWLYHGLEMAKFRLQLKKGIKEF